MAEAQVNPKPGTDWFQGFMVFELFFLAWFTAELLMMILISSPIHTFFLSFLNLMDVALVVVTMWSAVVTFNLTPGDVNHTTRYPVRRLTLAALRIC